MSQLSIFFTVVLAITRPAFAEDEQISDQSSSDAESDIAEETETAEPNANDEIPVFDLTGSNQSDQPEVSDRSDQSDMSDQSDGSDQSDRSEKNPRLFALGLALMSEHALGAVTRLRFNHVAIDLAYGVEPFFFAYTSLDPEGGDDEVKWEFDMALVNADGGVVVFFGDDQKKFQNGLRAQGIFNNIRGPGAGLGWVGDLCFNGFVLEFGAGIQGFFAYGDWVKGHFNLGPEAEISAWSYLAFYFGVNLLWYLA